MSGPPQPLTVLVDSSAWIEFLRRIDGPVSRTVDALLAADRVVTVPPIVAEVVSGARGPEEYRRLQRTMGALRRLDGPPDLWDRISEARYRLARKGLQATIVDLWISIAASESGVPLLTLDSDFDAISAVVPVNRVRIGP